MKKNVIKSKKETQRTKNMSYKKTESKSTMCSKQGNFITFFMA